MKVGINIEVEPGLYGGVAPALKSLLAALGRLDDGPERYVLVVRTQQQADWLQPLARNQEIAFHPPGWKVRTAQDFVGWSKDVLRNAVRNRLAWPEPPISFGYFESLGLDVVHFPTQSFTYCALPTVFNPHDLQHRHYPQFFTPQQLAWRESIYPAACRLSQSIIVNSQWTKEDVVRQYAVDANKIQVIPEAAPTDFMHAVSEADVKQTMERYGVSPGFAFYPSVTWPHKNHLRLVEALAYLRDTHGLTVPLVCTGSRHEASWARLQSRIQDLGLGEQVRFLGFVSSEELRCLYRAARCLVLPTLFEANSLPIFEAWAEGAPVASSNVTALPEQVGDAGLLFDPMDVKAIAGALQQLFTDDALCARLRARGSERLKDFDWNRTARAYRAIYRRTAGWAMSEDDRVLLSWDWMRDPQRAGRA